MLVTDRNNNLIILNFTICNHDKDLFLVVERDNKFYFIAKIIERKDKFTIINYNIESKNNTLTITTPNSIEKFKLLHSINIEDLIKEKLKIRNIIPLEDYLKRLTKIN